MGNAEYMGDFILGVDHSAVPLTKEALMSNSFETGVLQQWLHSTGRSLSASIVTLLADPNPADASPLRLRFTRPSADGALPAADGLSFPAGPLSNVNSCRPCAHDVMKGLVYSLRERIPAAELPAQACGRSNCWYGRGCRTQAHKREHAERLNHICEQTRFR